MSASGGYGSVVDNPLVQEAVDTSPACLSDAAASSSTARDGGPPSRTQARPAVERDPLLNSRYSNRVYEGGRNSSINQAYKDIGVSSLRNYRSMSTATATAALSLNYAATRPPSAPYSYQKASLSSYSSGGRGSAGMVALSVEGSEEAVDGTSASTDSSSSSSSLAAKAVEDANTRTLVVAFFCMLLFQLGNRIFGRLQTYPMHNYPIFMNMLSVSIYIPICFAYILPMMRYSTKITREQLDIPKYKFAIMGAYDSLAGIMQTFAVNYISNSSTIVLVQQSAIPISMAISKVFLQAHYTPSQYLGALVVLLGIAVVLIPNFQGGADSPSHSELLWIFVLVVSCVPMCLSSVYKEKALGEMEIDVIFLNGWVAVFQFLIALPLLYPSSLVINIPVSGILPNLYGGALCWCGYDSITEANLSASQTVDNCSSAPLFVNLYLLFNIGFNLLIVVILKHGSANILWMASTVIVPLSNVAFSLDFMPGHKPLKTYDIIGLFVIMVGLILYRFMASILSAVQATRAGGSRDSEAERSRKSRAKAVGIRAEGKQTKYVGINQIEGLETFVDTRIWKEQKRELYRSPQQIRGSLLLRLGIPPSPTVSYSPAAARERPGSRAGPQAALKRTLSFNEKGVLYSSV